MATADLTEDDNPRTAISISKNFWPGAVQGPAAPHHRRQRRRRQIHADRPPAARRARRLRRSVRSPASRGGEIDFALLTDGLRAEREQGITIDVAYRYFATPKRKFILADTPGHEQYTRNMATGASTAELAIILCDAARGLTTQSRRHAYIAALLGIPHFVIAVNKMDLVDFDQTRFRAHSRRVRPVPANAWACAIRTSCR